MHSSIHYQKKSIYWFAELLAFLDRMYMNNTGMTYKPCIYSGYFLPVVRETRPVVIQPHILQAYSEDNQAHLEKARQLTDSVKMISFPKMIPLM